jgi:ribosomal protein L25 (general stress protein Ctc)
VIDWARHSNAALTRSRGVRRSEAHDARNDTRRQRTMPEKITAEMRTEFGKGAARRIRRDDKIPAVVYGHGNETVHVTLPGHATMMALKHGGSNALLELDIEGKSQLALTKQVQVDPIRRVLEHIVARRSPSTSGSW